MNSLVATRYAAISRSGERVTTVIDKGNCSTEQKEVRARSHMGEVERERRAAAHTAILLAASD
jgi:hypothetical protein